MSRARLYPVLGPCRPIPSLTLALTGNAFDDQVISLTVVCHSGCREEPFPCLIHLQIIERVTCSEFAQPMAIKNDCGMRLTSRRAA